MITLTNLLVAVGVLIVALIIDLIFGDPSPIYPEKIQYKLHPTVLMGEFTQKIKPFFKNPNPKIEKFNGVLLGLTVILVFTVPVYFGLQLIYRYLGLVVFFIVAAVILKLTICMKLETDWGYAAAKAIEAGNLTEARKYAHFSRRDNKELTGAQIVSSVIESLAENLTDFRLSPIFYYGLFGVPGAVAFRAVNTLDGMVGFKDEENINIGWFSAITDTIVNYIPARLTTLLLIAGAAIIGEDYKNAWKVACRDQNKIPSTNHGWQMAAIAGALRVELEKPGQYAVGDPEEELDANKIIQSLKIRNVAIILSIIITIPAILLNLYLF
ncbi:MAG: cobalamin biosynthesis protein [Candidatus Bathyarchaeota archaeon]|nr:cobalamin biosynthesis protein [Candidatus Bathyarchaeota archaeon]